jgi:ATP-dependent Lon protease
MGARRAGTKCIILLLGCKRDYEEIPEYLKEGLEIRYAEDYETVYDVAFGNARQK